MSPGSGIPEVPALLCLILMPLPAAEPEVRLDGSGQLKGGLGVLRGPRSQPRLLPGLRLRRWLWVWSCPRPACLCLAPSPWHCLRICLLVQESKATCYSLPCVPNTWALGGLSAHMHLLQWGGGRDAGATESVWVGREAPSHLCKQAVLGDLAGAGQERPFPENVLENNPDPASSPKPAALSPPSQGRCWAPGTDLCVRVSRGGGERGQTAPGISRLSVSFLRGPSQVSSESSSHITAASAVRGAHSRGRRLQDFPMSG